MKLLHNANNNIEWGALISRLSRIGLGGVYVFPITSCWPCAPFCYSSYFVFHSTFLHIGLSFICLIAHSAHCAILIRCDIVKSDAIFHSIRNSFGFCTSPAESLPLLPLVQWVQLLRFFVVVVAGIVCIRLICLA